VTTHRRRRRIWTASAVGSFIAGILVGGTIIWNYSRVEALGDDCGTPAVDVQPSDSPTPEPRPASEPPAATKVVPVLEADPLADLRQRVLTLPVQGIDSDDLTGSFDDKRGEGRRHEAIDILAPRNTPVLAVEDGTIARLFTSKAGGLTVYQFDPGSTYAYYYAHLERYAPGLKDGTRVRRGQVVGYVGTSGNAPPDTPHLHFAIFKLADKKRWWEGTPIDPFAILR
jgi:murein DD-endopeptidase MepM/ murein hydrolase activator NlpD